MIAVGKFEIINWSSMCMYLKIAVAIFVMLLFAVMVLAAIGKSLGVREKYVEILLWAFEYGREKIEMAERKNNKKDSDEVEDEFSERNSYSTSVISRAVKLHPESPGPRKFSRTMSRTLETLSREFQLDDAMEFVKAGVEAIIEDEVTQRFSAEELPSWNLLTRTNKNYMYINLKVTVMWGLGFCLRYLILLPGRLILFFMGVGLLTVFTAAIGYVPSGKLKQWMYWHTSLMCFRILSRAISAVVKYHNSENRAKGGGICVANHTSPIDVVMLASDNCYALVGQRQGGFLGFLQRALGRATAHIWFERFEVKDRTLVTQRLKEHVEDPEKLPILIFPEGTCINNTSVMMFKKGSFEVGGIIYPVAIKYDPRFGDPFWNSSKQSYVHYLLMMMTSWAIVCDVWYLPSMTREEGETAVDFANRVKSEIAHQGGLVDLVWDGQLKRVAVKQEWKARQQRVYSSRIKVD